MSTSHHLFLFPSQVWPGKFTYVGEMALNNKLIQERKNKMSRGKDIHLADLSRPTFFFFFCSWHSETLSTWDVTTHERISFTWLRVRPGISWHRAGLVWPGVPHQTHPKGSVPAALQEPSPGFESDSKAHSRSKCTRTYSCLRTWPGTLGHCLTISLIHQTKATGTDGPSTLC